MRVVPTPTTMVFLACTPSFIPYACPVHGQAYRLLSRPACLYRPGSFPTAEHYLIRPRSAFLPIYRGRFLIAEPYLSTPVDAHPSTPYPLSRLGHDKIMVLDYGRISNGYLEPTITSSHGTPPSQMAERSPDSKIDIGTIKTTIGHLDRTSLLVAAIATDVLNITSALY